LGLVAFDGPNDPSPSLVIDDGRVVELDGRRREDWDALDHFIVSSGLDLEIAREAAELEDADIARRLVDVSVSRAELVRLSRGLTGRSGILTQCAVEERLNLRLAILGLVTYAETLSVYGTEAVFVDGDDTPWSKAFLASAYASRGVKVRFTSGGGSEALMGESEGKSMLYLEARCLSLVRAAGSQGVQNGSISVVALVLSVPGGTREVLAENVLAAW